MADPDRIFIVIAGQYVLGVYRGADSAELHRRCITGARVVPSEILDAVPPEIIDDIVAEYDGDDDNTPTVPIRIEDFDDK